MPREFEDWRTRGHAQPLSDPQIIRRGRRLRVTKRIWQPRPRQGRERIRGRSAAAAAGYSRRPVLRPELYEQLKERMIDLVEETVQWP